MAYPGDVNVEAPEANDSDILLEEYLETDTTEHSDPEAEEEEECKDAKVMSVTQDISSLSACRNILRSSQLLFCIYDMCVSS